MANTSPPNGKHAAFAGLLIFALLAGCESSRDAQLAALSSPEGPTRAQAISELGKAGDAENLGDIVAHVGDPDPLVRSSVASALGSYDERKASDALGELAADSSEPVQVLAARSLARQKNPRAHSYLMLAYRRDGSAVRAAVVEGLEKSGGSASDAVKAEAKAFWEQLSSSLTKGGAAERAGAAEELGRSGRPEAVERLVPYLGADSRALAQAAALGLGESRLSQAREPLEAMLNEQDPDLQLAALQGLETLGSPESAPALAKTALKGGQVGRSALEVLGKVAGDGAVFCSVTLSDEPEIAGRAGELAVAHKASCDEAPLFAKLSRSVQPQSAALAAIAGLGGRPKADPQRVLSLLRSGAPEVRPLAARVAAALHLDAAAPDLHKAIEEAKGHLQTGRQRWVKDTLPLRFSPGYEPKGAIGGQYKEHEEQLMAKLAAQGAHIDETGVSAVGPLFSDDTADDAALLAEAAAAAIALGATDAAELEKGLEQDSAPLVRQAACRAAVYLPAPSGWLALKGLGADPDPAVRSKALELLPDVLAKADATPADRASAEAFLSDSLVHTDGTVDDLLLGDVGKLGGAQASPAALAALKVALERPATAGQAARALGQLATPEARAALLDRLHQEASPGLPDIVRALGELKAPEAAPAIRSLLFSVSPPVRAAAAQALLAMGDAQGQRGVEALRDDYYAAVRRAAGATAPPAPAPTPPPAAAATK